MYTNIGCGMISGPIFRVGEKILGYMCLGVWTGKKNPMHVLKLGEGDSMTHV